MLPCYDTVWELNKEITVPIVVLLLLWFLSSFFVLCFRDHTKPQQRRWLNTTVTTTLSSSGPYGQTTCPSSASRCSDVSLILFSLRLSVTITFIFSSFADHFFCGLTVPRITTSECLFFWFVTHSKNDWVTCLKMQLYIDYHLQENLVIDQSFQSFFKQNCQIIAAFQLCKYKDSLLFSVI